MDFNTTQTPKAMAHRKIRLVFLLVRDAVDDVVAISRNEIENEDDMLIGTSVVIFCLSSVMMSKIRIDLTVASIVMV